MIIRRASVKDIKAVSRLLEQVLTVHYKIRPDLYAPNTTKYNEAELTAIFSDDNTPVFVCENNGRVVGYAFCKLSDYSNHNNLVPIRSMYIDDLCVDEDCRGQNIGRTIFAYVKDYAESLGCYNLTLNVWEGNDNAKMFYDKMGMGIQRTTRELLL